VEVLVDGAVLVAAEVRLVVLPLVEVHFKAAQVVAVVVGLLLVVRDGVDLLAVQMQEQLGAEEQQVQRRLAQLVMVETAPQAQVVKAVEVVVQVVGLQEQVELVEPEVNQVAVAAEVVDQLTVQIQAQEGLEVRALFASIHGR